MDDPARETRPDGWIEVRTILPTGYSGAPPHFHVLIAQNGKRRGGGALYLEGDWPMDAEVYQDARAVAAWIAKVRAAGLGFEATAALELR